MEFRVLGSMEVLDGDRRVDLPTGRGRALLALLVLHAGEVVSAERLIDELWGENPPPTASTGSSVPCCTSPYCGVNSRVAAPPARNAPLL